MQWVAGAPAYLLSPRNANSGQRASEGPLWVTAARRNLLLLLGRFVG